MTLLVEELGDPGAYLTGPQTRTLAALWACGRLRTSTRTDPAAGTVSGKAAASLRTLGLVDTEGHGDWADLTGPGRALAGRMFTPSPPDVEDVPDSLAEFD